MPVDLRVHLRVEVRVDLPVEVPGEMPGEVSEARDTIAPDGGGAVFWVMVVVVAVVVFGAAAVAAGAGGTLAEPAGDPRPLAGIPGPVGPTDLAELRFPVVLRGYRMDAVDEVLDRLGGEIAARDARIAELETELGARPGRAPATEF